MKSPVIYADKYSVFSEENEDENILFRHRGINTEFVFINFTILSRINNGMMETERLILRDRTRALIAEMLEQSKEQQLKFFGFETLNELEEKLIRVKKGLANEQVDYKIFDLIEKESNLVIGSCGFHKWIKDHCRTEIGYDLHPKFQGQGFMTEGLQSILKYGFEEMNLNRIEALIAPGNEKSLAIMNKFGFIREGVLRGHYNTGETFEDSIIFSLLKSDFTQDTHS